MDFTQTNFLFASSKPEQLARFYSLVLGESISAGFAKNDFSIKSTRVSEIKFYRPSSQQRPSLNLPSSLAICFEKKPSFTPLSVIEEWIEEVTSLGGTLIEGPKLESFGAEAWFSDIEDNKFLLLVPLQFANNK